MPKKNLIEQCISWGFFEGEEFHLQIKHALEYIENCHKQGLLILGTEGFICENDEIRPRIDIILDSSAIFNKYPWSEAEKGCYTEAKLFLRPFLNIENLFVNFVLHEN